MNDAEEIAENVIGFEPLLDSMYKCKKGVIWKDSVAHYYLNGIEETLKLEKQLREGTYKARKPVCFKVTHPKERDIVSISFRDRVYQRSLNDNAIYPQMSKGFIYDNMACQKGKGTDKARNRLKAFLQKYYRKHGTDGYVLQCDISGYYPNMKHEVALETFKKKLDGWTYEKTETVLNEQYDGDTGYNPGSQMVQIAGISVLDELDHYIKEVLRIKYYIRYMDDFILIHESEEYLNNIAYMDAAAWDKYAAGEAGAKQEEKERPNGTPTGTTLELVYGVMTKQYGDGDARKAAMGSRYDEVQNMINHICSASATTLVEETKAGNYGNGTIRKTVLGDRYDEVQKIINGGSATKKQSRSYTVKKNDNLTKIAKTYGTTVNAIVQKNKKKYPKITANFICVGWVLEV